ncbi:DNRLRE domain-containing protein [Occultella glacieicola]|uniref:DNRLRE domain-containing protein n=1 Tax=Occultella glacieicola TaxID=2518684 RepID=A0ABY2DYG6_9MICO|nr:DNRLRE domain-containing protein [Occultella glacieicola]TDE89527.1 DNRLRE domain-containing protein [Occultella glacieicola]
MNSRTAPDDPGSAPTRDTGAGVGEPGAPYVARRGFLLGSAAIGIGVGLGLIAPRGTLPSAAAPATPAELIDDVITTHPRLLLTDFADITQKVTTVPRVAAWADSIVAQADDLLGLPVQVYEIPDGKRMTHAPVILRSYVLALTYQLTGDDTYAERLWDELEGAAAWPDWNPSHFLDTAGMTHAFAIGYDWLHEYWTPDRRELLAATIVTKGLEPGQQEYADGAFWTKAAHNWNAVCNGGLTMGSLAVAQEYREIAGDLIAKGLVSVPRAADEYAPDGGYPEGTGYWSYGTGYLVKYLASLISASGGAADLENKPGLAETGYFPIDLTGASGQAFNYYDSAGSPPRSTEFFWLAGQFDQPALTDWAAFRADLNAEVTDVIWFDPSHSQPGATRWQDRALDHFYEGVQVTTSRSSWSDQAALFVGVKGGSNATNHSDLDLGTFVLDALGVRWALDLGADDYNLPGYFAAGVAGQRWEYYRKRTDGQNTLLAGPSLQGGQAERAGAQVVRHEAIAEEAITVLDLGAATPALTSWQRGIRMLDERRQVIVQDEFTCAAATDVWWFLHTGAVVQIATDGRAAELIAGDARLLLRLLGTGTETFVQMPSSPLWTSPQPTQNLNAGTSKLAIRVAGVTSGVFAVQISPLRDGESAPTALPVTPLEEWALGRPGWRLSDLSVDGAALPGFRPDVFDYTVVVPEGASAPVVSGSVRGPLRVTQLDAVPGKAVLRVGAGREERTYTVGVRHEVSDLRPGQPVVASGDDGNLPVNVVDGDLFTRWSSQGSGEWIRLDLGAVVSVDAVGIAWYQGDRRASYFSIEVSDGGAWVSVLADQVSGTSGGVEIFTFDGVLARYVRYTGYGNSTNAWNSVAEFSVPGHPVTLPDPPVQFDRVELEAPAQLTVGGEAQVSATAYLSTGATIDPPAATWEWLTLDPQVAEVNDDGGLNAVGIGTTRVVTVVEFERQLRWALAELTVTDPTLQLIVTDADTFVRSGTYADANTGTTSALALKNDSSPNYHREAYLRFPALATGDFVSAELQIGGRVTDGTPSATVGVFGTSALWEERALTWNNRPPMTEQLGSVILDTEVRTYTVDVTDYVRAAAGGGAALAFGLQQVRAESAPGVNINIDARESGSPATLRIRLA